MGKEGQLKVNCMQGQAAAKERKQIARYDFGSRAALSRSIHALMILLQLYTTATCHSAPSHNSDVALVPLPPTLTSFLGRHYAPGSW